MQGPADHGEGGDLRRFGGAGPDVRLSAARSRQTDGVRALPSPGRVRPPPTRNFKGNPRISGAPASINLEFTPNRKRALTTDGAPDAGADLPAAGGGKLM